MAPIKKTISFSGLKNLKLALHAEADNFHQDLISLTFIDTKKETGHTFKLVLKFDLSSYLVKSWVCEGEYINEANEKDIFTVDKTSPPVSLEALYEKIALDIEKLYTDWLTFN